jgi:hypothetical protein
MYFFCCSMHFLCCSMYFFLCCSMWCLFCDVPCIVCVYMCTEQLPAGGYPIAVKYIISYIIFWQSISVFAFVWEGGKWYLFRWAHLRGLVPLPGPVIPARWTMCTTLVIYHCHKPLYLRELLIYPMISISNVWTNKLLFSASSM